MSDKAFKRLLIFSMSGTGQGKRAIAAAKGKAANGLLGMLDSLDKTNNEVRSVVSSSVMVSMLHDSSEITFLPEKNVSVIRPTERVAYFASRCCSSGIRRAISRKSMLW